MKTARLLENITLLSRRYGIGDYVKGGGGNTSAKNKTTLFVKPSGTSLRAMSPDSFLAMNREKLNHLFEFTAPENSTEREAAVSAILQDSVTAKTAARPSVEAPLHNIFKATCVVHTHPALVNGLTCAARGKDYCAELFPEAMWLDYADPGYTLFKKCSDAFKSWERRHSSQPQILFLENHGVFAAADTPREIDRLYGKIMNTLKHFYQQCGIEVDSQLQLVNYTAPDTLQSVYGGACFVAAKKFALPADALTPDHIVYMKAKVLDNPPCAASLAAFKQQYNYLPLVMADKDKVIAAGASESRALLTLQMAADASQIIRLSSAFGGVKYMSDGARSFIENWEAESYRSKQQIKQC